MEYFLYDYLSPQELAGFDRYKYKSVDTSPLANYVMHPFWNEVVKHTLYLLAFQHCQDMCGCSVQSHSSCPILWMELMESRQDGLSLVLHLVNYLIMDWIVQQFG